LPQGRINIAWPHLLLEVNRSGAVFGNSSATISGIGSFSFWLLLRASLLLAPLELLIEIADQLQQFLRILFRHY
jgi:hypothetical protein